MAKIGSAEAVYSSAPSKKEVKRKEAQEVVYTPLSKEEVGNQIQQDIAGKINYRFAPSFSQDNAPKIKSDIARAKVSDEVASNITRRVGETVPIFQKENFTPSGLKSALAKDIKDNQENRLKRTLIPSVNYDSDEAELEAIRQKRTNAFVQKEKAQKNWNDWRNSEGTALQKGLDYIGGTQVNNLRQDLSNKENEYNLINEEYTLKKQEIAEKRIQQKYGVNGNEYIALLEQKKDNAQSDSEKKYYENEIKRTRNELYGKTNVFEHIGNIAKEGFLYYNKGVAATVDFLLGTPAKWLGFENNIFTQANKDSTRWLEEASAETYKGSQSFGDTQNLTGQFGTALIAAVPDLLLTILSGGTSKTKELGTAAIELANPTFWSTLKNEIIQTVKSPIFYTSFVRELGTNYEENLEGGANEAQATLAALFASAVTAKMEIGGFQSLGDELAETKGAWRKLYKWALSSIEEGLEEPAQTSATNLINKIVYDHDKKIVSTTDEDSVFNLKRAAKEFAIGTFVGAALGGGQLTFSGIVNAKSDSQYKQIGKAAIKNTNIQEIIDYAKSSTNDVVRSIARQVDAKTISDADAGRVYQYAVTSVNERFDEVNTVEDLNKVISEYFMTSTVPKAVRNIASAKFAEKLAEMNVDPETYEGLTPETAAQSTPTTESEVESGVVQQSENILQDGYESDIINNNQETGVDINAGQQDGNSNQRIGREIFSSEGQTGAIQETNDGVYENSSRNNWGPQSTLRNQGNNRRIELTPEQKESLKTTAIKDENGNPKEVSHFTDNMDFETFAKGDIGFHFGSESQAQQHKKNLKKRNRLNGEGRIIRAHLAIKNPIPVSSDIMCWWPAHTALRLHADGVIDFEQYLSVYNLQVESGHDYDSPAAVELRKILDNLGYDGIVYQNNDFFEGEGESYIAFYPEQVIIVDYGKTNNQADTEVPANFMPETQNESDIDQEITDNDMYAKDPSQWSAESKNDTSVSKTFKEKLANLFSKNTDKKTTSISEIVKLIEKDFEVPISKGKFRQRAYGIYKNKAQAIRTKVSNALPTIAHELGHHLDNKYHLRNFESIGEAERVLKETRPDFYNSYKPMARPREAVAEFMRDYLADRNLAKEKYPFFFEEFERKLSEGGVESRKDLENIKIIGNKINEYYTAELSERAKAAILTRKEAKKINRMGADLESILTRVETEALDDAAIFKKISQKAYDLYYWAKKSNVRAKNTLSGYYMAGFKKDLVPARDKDGKIVKDAQGKNTYVPALKFVLSELENNEMVRDFEEYLVMRHGIEWLNNDLRVFADDTLNNKKYMQERIKELENQYSQFKEISENLYEWYRTFVYEYGVESGLMTKEQYQLLVEKYPCYVPFMRNVESKRGFSKSGLGNQNAPIKRAKGSGLEILSPIESIVIKIEQFMKAADRNAVMKEITETADEEGGFGWLLEEVPPDMIPKTLSSDVIKTKAKKTLIDSGFDESAADDFSHLIDTLIGESITDFQIGTIQGENVVAVRKDGKRKLYQIHDKNLLAALVGLQPNQFDVITKAVGKITKVFKALTTGSNAVWSLVSNMPRDFDSAYKYGSENNPIKYTVDYIKAVASQISGKESEAFKLYRTMGGGYNNSFANAKELQITTKELFKQNENLADKIKSLFNIVENVTKLADFVETAPRLAEFKRVYERTGDAKKAMLAAEEVTVNFNRSGKLSKALDQYLPYFNASLQANAKYAKTIASAFSKDGDRNFLVKSIVTAMIKAGITFGILGLFGDEGEDEYEKLSAYKKNNFYNIYLGDGKFLSIPKSQATGMFDSLLERVFEISRKEDVEWSQEIKDFANYMWLTFGTPMFEDIIVVGTALELASNEDFTGAPIVSSHYEDLVAQKQYNEKTSYIAKFIGQLLGWSPMKIDHVIESNLGVFGLINKSIGKKEKDWTLGTKTKVITDSAYSTDVLNNFYEKAEDYYSKAKSYPDNAEYVYKDKQYSAIKSIVSTLNDYGREDPAVAREFKILARNYVDNFEKKSTVNEKLIELLKRSKNDEILYDRTFKPTYTINKVEYKMEPEEYLELVDNYYKEVEAEYNEIFKMNLSDETTIRLLNNTKKNVYEKVSNKYKIKRK